MPAAGGASPSDDFAIGDIVLGCAHKEKEKWDGHRCQIVEILMGHYKCKMLEGPEDGPPAATPPAGRQPQAACRQPQAAIRPRDSP